MRGLLGLVLTVAAVMVAGAVLVVAVTAWRRMNAGIDPASWQEFSSEAGRFAVLMPGEPQEAAEDDAVVAGQKFTVHHFEVALPEHGLRFHVQYFDFPVGGLSPETYYDGYRDALVQGHPGSGVRDEKPVTLDGRTGRELVLEAPGKGVSIRRVFLVGRRAYLVAVAGPELERFTPDVEKFFDSFRVTGPGPEG